MRKSFGLWRAWALVVGVTIGNGIFMLPTHLAPYGRLSIAGWLLAAGGTIFVALLFGNLARKMPRLGGPYVYTREAFGDLPGFLISWGYWVSLWTATGAGGLAFAGYLTVVFPGLGTNPYFGGIAALAAIWLVTGINIAGSGSASVFQLITTLLKILPLFAVASGGFFIGDVNLVNSDPTFQGSMFSLFSSMILTVMWAFIGIESITIPADTVKDPEKTIPRALIIGTITVAGIYLVTTLGVMSVIPVEELAVSTSPVSDAAGKIFGGVGAVVVAVGALISIIGSMNGNVLCSGATPRAIALDGLFPKRFAKVNSKGAPTFGLLVSSFLASLMIAVNLSDGLSAIYLLMFKLSTIGTLLPYLSSSLAELYFLRQNDRLTPSSYRRDMLIALGATGFLIFALIGTSLEEFIWGGVLVLVGFSLYFLQKRTK